MTDLLAALLGDAGGPEFRAEHWGRHVVLGRGDVARFAPWYSAQLWATRVHLGAVDAARIDDHGQQQQVAIDPLQIDHALANGQTICADVSSEPQLAAQLAMLRTTTTPSPEQAFAKLYVSAPGAGFALHMDAHHVLVLQLEGTKRWQVTDAVVSAPLWGGKLDARGRPVHTGERAGEPIEDDNGAPLQAPTNLRSIDLAPGDCLYLPPGAWHATCALGPSVALSVSPPRATPLRILLHVLEQELARRPMWREDLVRDRVEDGGVPASIAARLSSCRRDLAALVADLDDATLQRAWALEAFTSAGLAAAAPQPPPLRPDDRLEHADAGGFVHLLAPAEDGTTEVLYLYREGGEWILPATAHGFVRALAEVPRFRAAASLSWDPRLDWDAAAEVLVQLERAGFLRRCGPP